MTTLEIAGFDGLEPRTSPTSLAPNKAQLASNAKLQSGELRNWNGPLFAAPCATPAAQTIYLLRNAADSQTRWLSFPDAVEVVPGPVNDIVETRVYYTRASGAFKTNWALASTSIGPYPTAALPLGVPAPVTAPVAALVSGGSLVAETRVYIETYVSTFGAIQEESAPGPASNLATLAASNAVTVTLTTPLATSANLTSRRIYRSQSTTSGSIYQFVVELPITTATYTDNLSADKLGNALQTLGWLQPPTGLRGLISLPSGALAGFVGNTVYMSVPGYPHAWPLAYAVSLPHIIVAILNYSTSIVVGTVGFPHILSGDAPGNYSVEKVPQLEPCVSAKSIVSEPSGVSFATPNGLMTIGYYSREVTTHALMRRQEWQAYNPTTIRAAMYDGQYVGVYDAAVGKHALVITSSPRAELLQQPTIFRTDRSALTDLAIDALAVFVDPSNAGLYYLDRITNNIFQADADPLNPLPYEWVSKRFVMPRAVSFSRIKVDADYGSTAAADALSQQVVAIQAANTSLTDAARDGSIDAAVLNGPSINGSLALNIPTTPPPPQIRIELTGANGSLARVALTSLDAKVLPPFRTRDVVFHITGDVAVRSVRLATSLAELKGEIGAAAPQAAPAPPAA